VGVPADVATGFGNWRMWIWLTTPAMPASPATVVAARRRIHRSAAGAGRFTARSFGVGWPVMVVAWCGGARH